MRGSIRRRGVNSFELRFDLDRVDSKRRSRSVSFKGTFKEAQKELSRLLTAADTGTLTDPSNMTVGEYLQAWLGSTLAQSPKTKERYGELAERQIVPHLGDMKMQKLTPEQHRTVARGADSRRPRPAHNRSRPSRTRRSAEARRRERHPRPQCRGHKEAAQRSMGRD